MKTFHFNNRGIAKPVEKLCSCGSVAYLWQKCGVDGKRIAYVECPACHKRTKYYSEVRPDISAREAIIEWNKKYALRINLIQQGDRQ